MATGLSWGREEEDEGTRPLAVSEWSRALAAHQYITGEDDDMNLVIIWNVWSHDTSHTHLYMHIVPNVVIRRSSHEQCKLTWQEVLSALQD